MCYIYIVKCIAYKTTIAKKFYPCTGYTTTLIMCYDPSKILAYTSTNCIYANNGTIAINTSSQTGLMLESITYVKETYIDSRILSNSKVSKSYDPQLILRSYYSRINNIDETDYQSEISSNSRFIEEVNDNNSDIDPCDSVSQVLSRLSSRSKSNTYTNKHSNKIIDWQEDNDIVDSGSRTSKASKSTYRTNNTKRK